MWQPCIPHRTNVSKVSSRRAVQQLIEDLPGSLGRLLANSLPGQGSVLVTTKEKGEAGELSEWMDGRTEQQEEECRVGCAVIAI
jgi:hypothetical protein